MKGEKTIDSIFPFTIIRDRYNGTYSGAPYIAFNLSYKEIPKAISATDILCRDFWFKSAHKYAIGLGRSPEEAAENLLTSININKALYGKI